MKKKIALLFSVLLFISFFFFCVYRPDGTEESKVLKPGNYAGEIRQAEVLAGSLSQSLDTGAIRLCFRGEELACDREQAAFYLPVDMETSDWEAGIFTEASGELKVLPLQDYTVLDKRQAVADGTKVPFLVFQEDNSAGAIVNVVFTGLPVVRMETDADLDIDTVFAGSVVFYEDCGQEEWTTTSVFQAHERGQTTRAYPKRGYRVNLISVTSTGVINDNKEPVFCMRNSDSWIFYAMYSDGTKIRDKFNIELWNQFGAVNTPYDAHFGTHMEYAELFVNGEYRGLYGIMEPIDSDQLQITDQEYLYKRTYGRELLPEVFDEVSPEEYLSALGMEIKGKDGAGTVVDWQQFRDYVELCQEDDETFAAGMKELLSMENAADIWLYLQMLYGEDNIYKNMFFAFKKEADGYRLYLVPWDVDLTWGNVYVDDAEELYVIFAPERAENYLEWPFADRLLELNVGNIQQLTKSRWEELRKDVLSQEAMDTLMEECIHLVQDSGAFARDAARWPDSRHDADYDGMKEFMQKRIKFLDEMIQE